MLPEERKTLICDFVNEHKAASATQLMELCQASEATIRRDLNELDHRGVISKVHGGAVAIQNTIRSDYDVNERMEVNKDEKNRIAKYAATLIQPNDLVYIDAGTTTDLIIDYVTASNVTFITNAVMHAKKISSKGYNVYLTGGLLKATTEALVGSKCYEDICKYQFSVGFFGTNGVSHNDGFTTPDLAEAKIKECAIAHTHSPYVLCDHAKFRATSLVRFANYDQACIIATGDVPKSYRKDLTMTYLEE